MSLEYTAQLSSKVSTTFWLCFYLCAEFVSACVFVCALACAGVCTDVPVEAEDQCWRSQSFSILFIEIEFLIDPGVCELWPPPACAYRH